MASTLIRSLHDVGAAAWFGGSLMGAVGLNGAAAAAKDPTERTRLSSVGWAKWAPVSVAAAAAHVIGGIGEIADNRNRLSHHSGTQANAILKTVVTILAAGATAYAGVLGAKVAKMQDEGARGATEPSPDASPELKSAQKQLKIVQWTIPALTGTVIVLGAQQGEQQRGALGLLDKVGV